MTEKKVTSPKGDPVAAETTSASVKAEGVQPNTWEQEQVQRKRVQLAALAKMREPFPEGLVSYKPQRLCKAEEYDKLAKAHCDTCGGYHPANKKGERPVVGHLSYVGHAAVTKRNLDSDLTWNWEPLSWEANGEPHFDVTGGLWIKLTVAGMTRLGYGHNEVMKYSEIGSRTKAVISDAIRNAAMRFGAALSEWHKGELGLPDPAFVDSLGWGGLDVEPTGKPAVVMPEAASTAGVVDKTLTSIAKGYASEPQLSPAGVAAPVAKKADEPLAEEGEVKFISKKLLALKDPDALILSTIGVPSIEGLTKANFDLLKNAVKGKK